MKNSKGFIIPLAIAIVAMLVIGGGVTYYYTKTKDKEVKIDQSAGWQTYTSAQYGFSLKYPSDLKINESGGVSDSYIARTSFYKDDPRQATFEVWIYKKGDLNLPTAAWEDLTIGTNKFIVNCPKREVGSFVSSCMIIPPTSNGQFAYAIFTNDPTNDQIVQKMLLNFKVSTEKQTADWKIYTNSTTGLSFNYPSDWYIAGRAPEDWESEDNVLFTKVPIIKGQGTGTKGFLAFNSNAIIVPKNQVVTPKEYLDFYYTDNNVVSREYITINGVSILKYQGIYDVRYIFFKADTVYQFVVYQKNPPPNDNPPYVAEDLKKLEQVIASLKFTPVIPNLSSFGITFRQDYQSAKRTMELNGWSVVKSQNPPDAAFPEIGYCGNGKDAICNVDFVKGVERFHFNVQSSYDTMNVVHWIVVGSE